jgi:hypothetical protein
MDDRLFSRTPALPPFSAALKDGERRGFAHIPTGNRSNNEDFKNRY